MQFWHTRQKGGSFIKGDFGRILKLLDALAAEGRFGDAMRALGSNGTASPDDQGTLNEMQDRHSKADLPPWSDDIPPPLVVDDTVVMAALRLFPRGSSPGGSKLRAQHLVDAIQGTTIHVTVECHAELTRLMNHHLAGQADRRLSPWLVGAPLTQP